MSILNDIWIASRCGFMVNPQPGEHAFIPTDLNLVGVYKTDTPMIDPFVPHQVREVGDPHPSFGIDAPRKIISYGLTSFGYDVRLRRQFKIFTNAKCAVIDPLNIDPNCFVDHEGDFCMVPPNSYILAETVERFKIPRDVSVICLGKSTYARSAAIVNVTPIEAGFEGTVVIEISNASNLPLKVYAGMGIAQFQFFIGNAPCLVSYADRGGKYQNQEGITLPRG